VTVSQICQAANIAAILFQGYFPKISITGVLTVFKQGTPIDDCLSILIFTFTIVDGTEHFYSTRPISLLSSGGKILGGISCCLIIESGSYQGK
jgi:hypothetical protein